MADLDDFFAKKDKKKKTKKGFAKGNIDVVAKNLEETERREQKSATSDAVYATSEAAKLALEEAQEKNGDPLNESKKANGGSRTVSTLGGTGSSTNDEQSSGSSSQFPGLGNNNKYFGIVNQEMVKI